MVVTSGTKIVFSEAQPNQPNTKRDVESIEHVTSSMKLMSLQESTKDDSDEQVLSSLQSIPGLEKAYKSLYEVISYPLFYPDLLSKLNLECPKGIDFRY